MKKVVADYKDQKRLISFENYHKNARNLDNYIHLIKGVRTQDKWRTWGRTYIEVPIDVLKEFGIDSNLPLVAYRNYVYFEPFNYCYSGSIFQGDAAWFNKYEDLVSEGIIRSESYKIIKAAMENVDKSKEFVDFFSSPDEKWEVVPIWNPELAAVASAKNSSLK